MAELSGEQTQVGAEPGAICEGEEGIFGVRGWDGHTGVAEHTLPSQSSFLETEKLFSFPCCGQG